MDTTEAIAGDWTFWVPGVPRTKGSLALRNRATGVIGGDPRERDWAALVTRSCADTYGGRPPLEGAIWVTLLFVMPTPSVIVQGPGAGDLDKLTRSILDALTKARIYRDDVQVTSIEARKISTGDRVGQYGQPGAVIRVQRHDRIEIVPGLL